MTILRAFDQLDLLNFSVVDDDGNYIPLGDPTRIQGRLCLGLFMLTRKERVGSP
jgi:hypothetical protein